MALVFRAHSPNARRQAPSLRVTAALLCAASLAAASVGYIWGPPASHTGAFTVAGKPAEPVCGECHMLLDENNEPRPNVNLPAGRVELLDVPPSYAAGQTYPIRVRLSCDSTVVYPNRTWGFELTAVRALDGEGTGQFDAQGRTDVQVINSPDPGFESRSYIEHREAGVHTGASSPVEWTVDWRAPIAGTGKVYFFAAGNAANGADDTVGDYIFTASDSSFDDAVAVRRTSWAALKQRYR